MNVEGFKVKIGVDAVRCAECHEYKIAMAVVRSFSWANRDRADKIIGFDREAEEITVNEHALMRIIQMVNPAQQQRKIRLVSQDEFYGVKK